MEAWNHVEPEGWRNCYFTRQKGDLSGKDAEAWMVAAKMRYLVCNDSMIGL